MPSPVGHALGGLIVALAFAPPPSHPGSTPHDWRARVTRALRMPARAWPLLAWCMVSACLPDVDFAWGRHNMETHSLGFALMLGFATLAWKRDWRLALACALAVSTHVLFDWLGSDDAAPLGVMALWPLTTEFYFANAWLFGAISRHYWRDDFVSQNVLAILRELALLTPLILALVFARRRSRQ